MMKRALTVCLVVLCGAAFGAMNNNSRTEDGRFVIEPGAVLVDGHRLATTSDVAVVQSNLNNEVARATNAEHQIQVQVDVVKGRTNAWDGAVEGVDRAVMKTGETDNVDLTLADVRIAEPTETNNPATKKYIDDKIIASSNVANWAEFVAIQDVDMDGSDLENAGEVRFADGKKINDATVQDGENLRLGGINALRLNKPAISGYLGSGRVVAWGYNEFGQSSVPADASNSIVAVSAGAEFSIALRSDGRVMAWGGGTDGQCDVPADASNSVVAIFSGNDHSLALRSDGRVVAWGYNDSGRCNVPADANDSVIAISCGSGHSLALRSDGRVVAWGVNGGGQCDVPADASNSIIGIAGGDGHTLALHSSGRVIAWGTNANNQCDVPADASNSVVAIAAGGGYHSLALRSDGRVICWGENGSGQCDVPADASNSVVAIAGGGDHSLALRSDGRVVAWGLNDEGQCDVPSDASNSVMGVGGGNYHSLAIRAVQELPEIRTPAVRTLDGSSVGNLIAFRASLTDNTNILNATTNTINMTTTQFNYGDCFDGTYFTAPVNGIYQFDGHMRWNRVSGTAAKMDIVIESGTGYAVTEASYWFSPVGNNFINSGCIYMTNGATAFMQIVGTAATTNVVYGENTAYTWFSGRLIRELP